MASKELTTELAFEQSIVVKLWTIKILFLLFTADIIRMIPGKMKIVQNILESYILYDVGSDILEITSLQ